MKNIYNIIGMLLIKASAAAQQQYPTAISAGGSSVSNGGLLLESSVGGLVVSSTSTFMYTQGFLQPDAGSTVVLPPVNDVVLSGGYGLTNAGATLISGNIMVEFTTGEAASITLNTSGNILTQGLLQPYNSAASLPVTGLDLLARRTDGKTVLLQWKTLQEVNNKGFHIERRFENENSFTTIGFLATAAVGGNSALPLNYQQNDNSNSFSGKTLYRIRQEDIDGRGSFSAIRMVDGNNSTIASIKVWPVPSAGPVNVLLKGIPTIDQLLLYDISGRLIHQQRVQNEVVTQIPKLAAGTYIIKIAGNKELIQQIIIQ